MSLSRLVISFLLVGVAVGGCAKPPQPEGTFRQSAPIHTGSVLAESPPAGQQPLPARIFSSARLAGRTLAVASTADIQLRPGEVILTFDDGPRAGKTSEILASLDSFGVKATFLMLGSAAEANPQLAQQVALGGHTVGSHTFNHVNLSKLDPQAAVDEITRGERAVAQALAGAGQKAAPFFRFPYLSQTGFLRTNLKQGNVVVVDVNIDSQDYFKDDPETVVQRTLTRLDGRGSGIILFHDIHRRTVDMLPSFLAQLQERGYSVVRLVPKDNSVFGSDLITAEAPALRGTL